MHPALPLLAQLGRRDVAQVTPESTLGSIGLNASLGLSVLRSAWRRKFGHDLPAITVRTTVAELLAMGGDGAAPVATKKETIAGAATGAPRIMSGPFGGRTRSVARAEPAQALPGHGVDIEEIAALPVWPPSGAEGAFYHDHFTAAELAAAGRHAQPRTHLCGLWCAKEAVKKSDADLLNLAFHDIEIHADESGRPMVRLEPVALRGRFVFALSLSHSAAYAVASVITLRR